MRPNPSRRGGGEPTISPFINVFTDLTGLELSTIHEFLFWLMIWSCNVQIFLIFFLASSLSCCCCSLHRHWSLSCLPSPSLRVTPLLSLCWIFFLMSSLNDLHDLLGVRRYRLDFSSVLLQNSTWFIIFVRVSGLCLILFFPFFF